jgi:hypothetical protein
MFDKINTLGMLWMVSETQNMNFHSFAKLGPHNGSVILHSRIVNIHLFFLKFLRTLYFIAYQTRAVIEFFRKSLKI